MAPDGFDDEQSAGELIEDPCQQSEAAGHVAVIRCVTRLASSRGCLMVSAGQDSRVVLWNRAPQAKIESASATVRSVSEASGKVKHSRSARAAAERAAPYSRLMGPSTIGLPVFVIPRPKQ